MTKTKGPKRAKLEFTTKRIERKKTRHLTGSALAEAMAKIAGGEKTYRAGEGLVPMPDAAPLPDPENKIVYESAIQVKSGQYRFTVKDSPKSGRYLLIEDVRIKNGKTRTERVVVYPELMEGFNGEYQKAKKFLSAPAEG